MAQVIGIGGVFIRSEDPEALAKWYRDALGIDFNAAQNASMFRVTSADEITVFSLFARDSSYIGEPDRQHAMVNFRVDDLEGVIGRLASFAVTAEPIQEETYGRFSWAYDPEGNRFELWESLSSTRDQTN